MFQKPKQKPQPRKPNGDFATIKDSVRNQVFSFLKEHKNVSNDLLYYKFCSSIHAKSWRNQKLTVRDYKAQFYKKYPINLSLYPSYTLRQYLLDQDHYLNELSTCLRNLP